MKLFSILILSIIFVWVYYGFTSESPDQPSSSNQESEKISSVSIKDGKYKVDTNVIRFDKNRKMLLTDLDADSLIEKENKAGIPNFIKAFLDSISSERKFDMADQGEEWRMENRNASEVLQTKHLPTRQLFFFAIGKKIAILTYCTGGFSLTGGFRRYQRTLMIKFKDKKVLDFWYDNNSGIYNTKEEIINNIGVNGNERC